MSVVSAYIMCADAAEARLIGRALVEEGLAACVNILGEATSIYRWKGQVEEGPETPMIAKTVDTRVEALIDRVTKLHSYENPAITVSAIAALPEAYADWVEDSTEAK